MSTITSADMVMLEGRRGRPMRAETHSLPRTVRLSPSEWQRVKTAANLNYQSLTEFTRLAILGAAEDTLENVE